MAKELVCAFVERQLTRHPSGDDSSFGVMDTSYKLLGLAVLARIIHEMRVMIAQGIGFARLFAIEAIAGVIAE